VGHFVFPVVDGETIIIGMTTTLIDIRDIPEHLVMRDVSWSYYEQTLKEIGDQGIRVAYLDGVMELMSPLPEHEGLKRAIGILIGELAMEWRIPTKGFGSATFRSEEKAAGSEPDECFYFHDIATVQAMKRFDPAIHRAPDLWVEVDITSSSVARETIHARLGVPEIWHYRQDRLTIRLLTPELCYVDSSTSLAFPKLPITSFASFIPKMAEGDEVAMRLEFREWVRGFAGVTSSFQPPS
jgi:Uma2 family endonuclease